MYEFSLISSFNSIINKEKEKLKQTQWPEAFLLYSALSFLSFLWSSSSSYFAIWAFSKSG
jgi:hypothetical protein